MRTGIIGRGVSGLAAARLAQAAGHKIEFFEDSSAAAEKPSYTIFAGFDLLVVSPGVPPFSPVYQAALASGVELISEMEFGARHFDGPMLAITGTNGKTTTTELTVHLLQAFGVDARPAGNIGFPLCDICADILEVKYGKGLLPVIEVSSFQLERCFKFKPFAAVLLNITSDHLNRYHDSMAEYAATKFKIFDLVPVERRVGGLSLCETPEFKLPVCSGNEITVSGGDLLHGGKLIVRQQETQLHGPHNLENLVASLELVRIYLGSDALFSPVLKNAICEFAPGRHRLEQVAEHSGVVFINDSKATNPASVIAALQTVSAQGRQNVNIILGGLDKDMDFSSLREVSGFVKKGFIIGQCRQKIFDALSGSFPCELFDTFKAAVGAAARNSVSGDIVLLSPACASMDMFKDYKDRGDQFRDLASNPDIYSTLMKI